MAEAAPLVRPGLRLQAGAVCRTGVRDGPKPRSAACECWRRRDLAPSRRQELHTRGPRPRPAAVRESRRLANVMSLVAPLPARGRRLGCLLRACLPSCQLGGYTAEVTELRASVGAVGPHPTPEPLARFQTAPGHQSRPDSAEAHLPWDTRFVYSRLPWLRFYPRWTMQTLMEGIDDRIVPPLESLEDARGRQGSRTKSAVWDESGFTCGSRRACATRLRADAAYTIRHAATPPSGTGEAVVCRASADRTWTIEECSFKRSVWGTS
jgi:hypothetical protein